MSLPCIVIFVPSSAVSGVDFTGIVSMSCWQVFELELFVPLIVAVQLIASDVTGMYVVL